MEIKEVLEKLPSTLLQVKEVATNRKYGMGITCAYYVGGTLCVDIYAKGHLSKILIVNISSETITIIDSKTSKELKFLLNIECLKIAFDIYKAVKGANEYYKKSFKNSCLRHLA